MPALFSAHRRRVFAALLTLLAIGCAAPARDANDPARSAAPQAAAPQLSAQTLTRIAALLQAADAALEREHLTTPTTDNAFDRYLQVLVLDPGNADAQRGLERIVEAYLTLALDSARQGDRPAAEFFLRQARQIDPEHPSLAPTAERLRRVLLDGDREVLDRAELERRAPVLQQRLEALAGRAKSQALFTIITAPDDASGRWIYQVMNNAAPHQRLRASLEIGLPPAVELRPLDASP